MRFGDKDIYQIVTDDRKPFGGNPPYSTIIKIGQEKDLIQWGGEDPGKQRRLPFSKYGNEVDVRDMIRNHHGTHSLHS